MIERSESARYAKALFYTAFNDIDVFVEDTALESKKVYVELLNRILKHKFSVSQVFPVGTKSTVIRRCREDQGHRERPALYIVDGDYDELVGVALESLKRLYRLKRYCVENYLLDAEALIDVLNDETLLHDEGQIRDLLDYAGWMAKAVPALAQLVLTLVVSHVKQCGMPTVNVKLSDIRGDFPDHVDAQKVQVLLQKYEAAVDAKYGEKTFERKCAALSALCASDASLVFRHGSAKALLLPLVSSRIRRRVGVEVDLRKLRVKLARRCDVSEMEDLAECVG